MPLHPQLFVISGPSGVGKGTLVKLVRKSYPELALTVSATTRSPRAEEIQGVSYHFLSDEVFDELIASGEFLEWTRLFAHRYGTLKSEVTSRLDKGCSIALEIDVEGARNVRKAFPSAVLIFIEPPSREELRRRLIARGTEDQAAIERRLARADEEMKTRKEYDVRIVNDDPSRAAHELLEVIRAFEA